MTKEQIIELGMDHVVQCIKFDCEEKLEDTYITISLNVLGVIYSLQIPKHEVNENNVSDGWKQLIKDFGVFHMLGQTRRVQDGSRKMTEEEMKMLEEKN